MEFYGFIFTKEEVIKDFTHPDGYKTINDYSINSNEVKKYNINGKWIFSANKTYLKSLNLRKYIIRSKTFAKILFSSKHNYLKFDYIENGKFKKQFIIKDGELLSNIGFSEQSTSSKNITEIFFDLIKSHFDLNKDFIEPKEENFINQRNPEYQLGFWDHLAIRYTIKGVIWFIAAPFLLYLIFKVITEAQTNSELQSVPTEVYIIFLILFLSICLIFTYAFLIIKNYLNIKNKVLNDDLVMTTS